ncbi:hypothetical protein JCGZ_09935 [Jatropha curcas]|uniref:Protein kinase domain-containing protein n=1 Tax=Jatropha curcas TaxID=180498 RepID=A0A067KLS1_JATCU|nr:L-type lectin-domain containing receptor kinase IX.1 [Jatropha curcas]KDP35963.1 hypothetical protein JCGZ_09935 [Jatropha curcas]
MFKDTISWLNIIILFLFLPISCVTCLSFSFTSFGPSNYHINYQGDASPLDSVNKLTPNLRIQRGPSTYVEVEPMHLWEKASGNLVDFTTNLSFSIDAQNNASHAVGLAFFIAPAQYTMPGEKQGSGIGLASGNNSIKSPPVAVEFDAYYNQRDNVDGDHVGIDMNSLKSSRSQKWYRRVMDRRIIDVRISYNSSSNNLCVYFAAVVSENIIVEQKLPIFCNEIDLRIHLPEWVTIGFSAASGLPSVFDTIHSWSFASSFQCSYQKITTDLSPPPPVMPVPRSLRQDKDKRVQVVVTMITFLTGACVLVLVARLYRHRTSISSFIVQSEDNEFERVTGAKKIPYNVLIRATNNFNEKLGEGGFGVVYKAYLKDSGIYVAVKRISESSTQGISEYKAEVMILSQLRHRNLVQLIGWCHEKKEILLVYEYMPNRSLDFHLFNTESLLKWGQRYKIARGLAYGLQYLHEGWRQCVLHRDIKSSNVMLDLEFNPMLGDFGLARLVDHNARSQTLLGGSHGYIAPECLQTGKSSKESDVFSFGVVALEIACGRKPFVVRDDGIQMHIVKWVWEFYTNGKLLKAADQKLQGQFTRKEMKCLMIVGLWCAHPYSSSRPSMAKAIKVLNFDIELPKLESKFPGQVNVLKGVNSNRRLPVSKYLWKLLGLKQCHGTGVG